MEVILTGENSMDVQVGTASSQKPHPCGNSTFAVLRVGMDFRIRCTKCGREVAVPRSKIEKHQKSGARGFAALAALSFAVQKQF
ncbi:MAG: DUF951 domain-containing protein [Ruthenibacterium lactatiformans]